MKPLPLCNAIVLEEGWLAQKHLSPRLCAPWHILLQQKAPTSSWLFDFGLSSLQTIN